MYSCAGHPEDGNYAYICMDIRNVEGIEILANRNNLSIYWVRKAKRGPVT
jgi:hypothetical protein